MPDLKTELTELRRNILSMAAIVLISLLMAVPTYVLVVQILVLSASALFIITRPLPAVFVAISIILLIWPFYQEWRSKKN